MYLLDVPYFSQNDNKSERYYAECFGSSVAMLLAYKGVVKTDDEYIKKARKYGQITTAQTHIDAVRSYGLTPKFRTDGTKRDILNCIVDGIPVAVGWLHKGTVSEPIGFGHWSVIVGYDEYQCIHHDPNGEAKLAAGGYTDNLDGNAIAYSWRNWLPRWEVRGNDGYMFYVR